MKWDIKKVQDRLLAKEKDLYREVRDLARKAKTNPSYKGFHDRALGAQQIYIRMSTSATLKSRYEFVRELKILREDDPSDEMSAFDFELVKLGWNETLDILIKEYDKPNEETNKS